MNTTTETTHITSIKSEGSGFMEKKTPVCTCGWVGIGYEAYCNWQHTLVTDQTIAHLKEATREPCGD